MINSNNLNDYNKGLLDDCCFVSEKIIDIKKYLQFFKPFEKYDKKLFNENLKKFKIEYLEQSIKDLYHDLGNLNLTIQQIDEWRSYLDFHKHQDEINIDSNIYIIMFEILLNLDELKIESEIHLKNVNNVISLMKKYINNEKYPDR